MFKINNYILIFACCFLIFFLCQPSLALDVGLQQAGQTGLGAKDVRITIAEIIKVAMGILGIIVIGIVLISGVYYMLSKNDPEKK